MSLFSELKRRNVVRVAVAYLVFGWLVLQIGDVLFPALRLPEWSITLTAVLLVLGLVAALIFAWVYELTPEGIRRESEVDRSASITGDTGRKLDLATIVMVVLAAALLLADRFLLRPEPMSASAVSADRVVTRPEGVASGAAGGIPIIAVLPFKATGSDDGGFLAAGLHDDLLTRLAKLQSFNVISRTSMMEYAGTNKNMRQIGEELGAGYILEGGVQALGNRLRINAQLIDAAADEHIWADTYDRELTAENLFDVQAELAGAIAAQMRTTLTDTDRALMSQIPTQSTEAYQAYLRALEINESGGFTSQNKLETIHALERAVDLDPGFALAWARLSIARTELAQIAGDEVAADAALSALAQARALQPDLLETEMAWAVYLYRGLQEYGQALQVLETLGARHSLDGSALELQAYLLRRVGRFRDAYTTMLQASELEPRNVSIAYSLISMAFMSDDCNAAKAHAESALRLAPDRPDVRTTVAEFEMECTGDARRANELMRNLDFLSDWHRNTAANAAFCARDYQRLLEVNQSDIPVPAPWGRAWKDLGLADAYMRLGRTREASVSLETAETALDELDAESRSSADVAVATTWLHALKGDQQGTRHWAEVWRVRSHDETKGDRYTESEGHFYRASAYAMAGLYDAAVNELQIMLEEPGGKGFQFVELWPDFDPMRAHPGYVALQDRYRDVRRVSSD